MKGQAFESFKIMMGAVFAVALLFVIYAIIASMQSPLNSSDSLQTALRYASNAPAKCFSGGQMTFNKGDELVGESFNALYTVCFSIPERVPFNCISSGDCCQSFRVQEKVPLLVSAKCDADYCTVYFNSDAC